MKELMDNHRVVQTDEHGATLEVIQLGPFNMPMGLFTKPDGDVGMKDYSKIPIRDDDIFLFSYPKTGGYTFVT